MKRLCDHCEKSFTTKKINQKFCSRKCYGCSMKKPDATQKIIEKIKESKCMNEDVRFVDKHWNTVLYSCISIFIMAIVFFIYSISSH